MTERKVDLSKFNDFEISQLILRRNALQFEVEQIDELLNRIGAYKGFEDAEKKETAAEKKTAVLEETFTVLKFDVMQGAKIGEYEVAYKASNIAEKWTSAYDVLRNSNATIKDRYYGKGYSFSYWLYNEKIYRQKLKAR